MASKSPHLHPESKKDSPELRPPHSPRLDVLRSTAINIKRLSLQDEQRRSIDIQTNDEVPRRRSTDSEILDKESPTAIRKRRKVSLQIVGSEIKLDPNFVAFAVSMLIL
jgi:hypothetical protein